MLQVIKRSGKTEEYSPDKMISSLSAAGDEIGQPLNSGDLRVIIADISRILEGKATVMSSDLYAIVLGVLGAHGFDGVFDSYRTHDSNAWH